MPELCCSHNNSWRIKMWLGSGESPRTRSLHSEPSPGVKVPDTSYSGEPVLKKGHFTWNPNLCSFSGESWDSGHSHVALYRSPYPFFSTFYFILFQASGLEATSSLGTISTVLMTYSAFRVPIKILSFLFKAEEKQWTFRSKEKLHI